MFSRLNDFVPCSTHLLYYGAFGPCSALELCRKIKFSNNVHQQLYTENYPRVILYHVTKA